jgi:DNA-binding response OmpR family regulator
MDRILAIDDERLWLELYAEKLTDAGFTVSTLEDGRSAVREIERLSPALVILDVRMSPSGRDVLSLIRTARPDLPVIISSAYGGYRDDRDFARANAFIEKSTDFAELLAAIQRLVPGRPQVSHS